MSLSNDMKSAVMKQLFGVGFAAGSEHSILSEVLMYYRYLTASFVKVCYDLAPGTGRFPGRGRTRVPFAESLSRKFSRLNLLGIAAAVEELSDLLG